MTRARGRADVERMLGDGKLERVPPSQDVSKRLFADATAHVRLAAGGIDEDPSGALQLSYDAARKACAALLAVQGLRATVRGGHVAVIDAVRAQFADRGDTAVFAAQPAAGYIACAGEGTQRSTRTQTHRGSRMTMRAATSIPRAR